MTITSTRPELAMLTFWQRVRQRMISTYQHNRGLQKAKPFTLHCSLLLIVFVYAFLGGLVFNRLEAKALEKQKNEEYQAKLECVRVALEDARLHKGQNNTVLRIANCWTPEKDERSEWGYMTATLYGFGICTTLGYNRIAPVTTKGRLFCMLYGIIGIPMTMIIIANVGQYLREFAGNWRKKIEIYRVRRRESKMIDGDLKDVQDASIEYVSLALLLVFSAYIALGAWLLPLLNGQIDFINGLYYNFLCLTAMDFGQLAPQKVMFLPITFIYVCFGLAITTIAIEVGSEYMKKLHYLGQRVKSVATTKIWFGSKNLRVRDLLHAVGRKCGVDPDVIDGIDLENVVERTIAINEGREPPEDTNDVYPPQEPGPKAPDSPSSFFSEDPPDEPPPSPPKPTVTRSSTIDSRMFNIKTAVLRTVSNQTTSALGTFEPSMDKYNVVAIDVTSSSIDEQVINFEEPIVVGLPSEVVVTPETSLQAESSVPVVLLDKPKPEIRLFMEPEEPIKAVSPTPSVENTEPKNFEEKKQRYAKDAGKLLETYQEEWDRLARLSDEKYRRKSVLFPYSTGNHHSGGDASSTGSARSK